MSGDGLDLAAIKARAARTLLPLMHGVPFTDDARSAAHALAGVDVPRLVAEIERLRKVVESAESF